MALKPNPKESHISSYSQKSSSKSSNHNSVPHVKPLVHLLFKLKCHLKPTPNNLTSRPPRSLRLHRKVTQHLLIIDIVVLPEIILTAAATVLQVRARIELVTLLQKVLELIHLEYWWLLRIRLRLGLLLLLGCLLPSIEQSNLLVYLLLTQLGAAYVVLAAYLLQWQFELRAVR